MSSNPILPTELVEKIVGHCEFPVVQALRKSSNSLRDLVGSVSPKSSITSIYMKSNLNSIQLNLTTGNPTSENADLLFPAGNQLNIEYKPHEQGCCVVLEKEGGEQSVGIVKGDDYKKIFWQDFEIFLKYHGGALLEHLHVDFERVDCDSDALEDRDDGIGHYYPFFHQLERVLEKNHSSLKMKNIAMRTYCSDDYKSILLCLDPNTIKGIQASWIIRTPVHFQSIWNFIGISHLPFWREAKHLDIQDFMMNTFSDVLNFCNVKGLWEIVEVNDFIDLVETFFKSANPAKHFTIQAMQIPFLDDFRRMHGGPPRNKWYFRSPHNNILVLFLLTQDVSPFAFEIKAVPLEEVEDVERIQDWGRVFPGWF